VSPADSLADVQAETLRLDAAAWFARMRGPNALAHQAEFDRWRGGRPDRQAAYDRLLRRWDEAGVLSMSRSDLGLGHARARRRPARARWAAGAIFAGATLGMVIYLAPARPDWFDAWPVPSAWSQRLSTSVGEIRTVKLPDGSAVTLDTGTVLRWRISASARKLALLRGRARFAVAHDPGRPFVVAAGGARVTAHGTLFDVLLTSGRTVSVTLLQGVVAVDTLGADRAKSTMLAPGQALAFSRDQPAPRLRRLPVAAQTWPTGMLTFTGTPLSQAVAEANRYSRTPIRLATPDLGQLQVSGAFHAGVARPFANSLAATFDLQVREGSDGALILGRPSGIQTP